jgi:nucleoside-diphosphate-sugar epimerase
VASLEKLKLPSVMNIGSDSENHRKLDIVQLICSKLDGVTPQIRNLGDGRDRRNYRVGFGLMTSSLGLTPTYSVEHTIEQVAMGLNYSLFDMPGVRYGNT